MAVAAPRGNCNVNCGLWVIMTRQCGFINCNQCTTLVGGADNKGVCACVEAQGVWENSSPSTQFFCDPKTALK